VHALGATYAGKPVGSFGRAAFFSTEETKTISTTMGGMVVTNDDDLAARLRHLQKGCGSPSASSVRRLLLKLSIYHALSTPSIHWYARALFEGMGSRNPLPGPTTPEERRGQRPRGYEQRLSNAQAALGLRQLKRIVSNISHRRAVASDYDVRLSAFGIDPLQPVKDADPAFVRYPVWVQDREKAARAIARHTVVGRWFTSVLEESDSPSVAGYDAGSCPVAEAAATHLINLPTHPRVSIEDIDAITRALGRAVGDRGYWKDGCVRSSSPGSFRPEARE